MTQASTLPLVSAVCASLLACEGADVVAIVHAEALGGRAGLDRDFLALEIGLAGDGAALSHDDGLRREAVGVGEQDVLLALFGHGDAGHTDVKLAGLYAGEDGVEVHLVDLERHAELFADEVQDVDLNADDLVVVAEGFERGEVGAGRDSELPGLLDALERRALFAAAGEHRADHERCKQQCDHLFHR